LRSAWPCRSQTFFAICMLVGWYGFRV
jgi:hypothetical protein